MNLRRAGFRAAFTLIELIVVMAIIVVLASMAAPRFGNSLNNRRVEMAAHRIAADLKLARQRARTTGSAVRVVFDALSDSYGISGVVNPDHPEQAYRVSLVDDPYRVDLARIDVGGDDELVFDAFGEVDTTATLEVESGATTYEIKLAPGGIQSQVSRTR